MRVTRDSLLRLARETAQERAYNQPDIIAIYLIGSLRQEEPFLGNSTDIDLVIVHEAPPAIAREIISLPANIHLDILHRARADYSSPRQLRLHPLLGHELYDAMLIHERQPFFEFVQAGVRGGMEFHAPATLCQRAFRLLSESRKGWLELSDTPNWEAEEMNAWLETLTTAANALMEMDGTRLTERRFLSDFSHHLAALDLQDLFPPFLELLGAFSSLLDEVAAWIPNWETDFQRAAQSAMRTSDLHPARLSYYLNGMRHYLESGQPLFALWPLLRTWTWAALALPEEQRIHWNEFMHRLGWAEKREEQLSALDRYLDRIQEALETYAAQHGVNLDALPPLL
ncbi:MAG: hypothetical protein ACK8QZ_07540 [Anaerolineales bacterium]